MLSNCLTAGLSWLLVTGGSWLLLLMLYWRQLTAVKLLQLLLLVVAAADSKLTCWLQQMAIKLNWLAAGKCWRCCK